MSLLRPTAFLLKNVADDYLSTRHADNKVMYFNTIDTVLIQSYKGLRVLRLIYLLVYRNNNQVLHKYN